MNILEFLFWFPVSACNVEQGTCYVLVFCGCRWEFVPYTQIVSQQTLSFDCGTFALTISWLAGNTVDLSCLVPAPLDCYPITAEVVWNTLILNADTTCEVSVTLPWGSWSSELVRDNADNFDVFYAANNIATLWHDVEIHLHDSLGTNHWNIVNITGVDLEGITFVGNSLGLAGQNNLIFIQNGVTIIGHPSLKNYVTLAIHSTVANTYFTADVTTRKMTIGKWCAVLDACPLHNTIQVNSVLDITIDGWNFWVHLQNDSLVTMVVINSGTLNPAYIEDGTGEFDLYYDNTAVCPISKSNYINFVTGDFVSIALDLSMYNIRYADLMILQASNRLVPGMQYKILDYQTIHLIPSTAVIHTGNVEYLVVTALTTDILSSTARSESYPDDELEYDSVKNAISMTANANWTVDHGSSSIPAIVDVTANTFVIDAPYTNISQNPNFYVEIWENNYWADYYFDINSLTTPTSILCQNKYEVVSGGQLFWYPIHNITTRSFQIDTDGYENNGNFYISIDSATYEYFDTDLSTKYTITQITPTTMQVDFIDALDIFDLTDPSSSFQINFTQTKIRFAVSSYNSGTQMLVTTILPINLLDTNACNFYINSLFDLLYANRPGLITRRKNLTNNIEANYDWREATVRSFKIDYTTLERNVAHNYGTGWLVYLAATNKLYSCIVACVWVNPNVTHSQYRVPVMDYVSTKYCGFQTSSGTTGLGIIWTSIPLNLADFIDTLTIVESSGIYAYIKNVRITSNINAEIPNLVLTSDNMTNVNISEVSNSRFFNTIDNVIIEEQSDSNIRWSALINVKLGTQTTWNICGSLTQVKFWDANSANVFYSLNFVTLGGSCNNNTIGTLSYSSAKESFWMNKIPFWDHNYFWNYTYQNTFACVNQFQYNTIDDQCSCNIFMGWAFVNNTIGKFMQGNTQAVGYNDIYGNTFGERFQYNDFVTGAFSNNICANQFWWYNATVRNQFLWYMRENHIAFAFWYGIPNSIKDASNNDIWCNFIGNNLTNSFSDNVIGADFQNNTYYTFNNNITQTTHSSNSSGFGFGVYSNNFWIWFTYNNMQDFVNNNIGHNVSQNVFGDNFEYNTLWSYIIHNNFWQNFKNNKIGHYMRYTVFGVNSMRNNIGDYCRGQSLTYRNVFSQMTECNIWDHFGDNGFNTIWYMMCSNIWNGCYNRNISGEIAYCTIWSEVYKLTFNQLATSTIGKWCFDLTCTDIFQLNVMQPYGGNTIDFSLATHVKASYNTEMFKNANGDIKLKYIDASNNTVVVNPTD